jgi:hypothetical protein
MGPFPEDLVHATEPFLPEAFVVRKPLGGLSEWSALDRVQVLSPRFAKADNARVPEQPQLLRHGRLGHAGSVDELVDRPFAVTKGIEELPSGRLCEKLEDVVHKKGMPKGIYVCLCIRITATR